MTLRNFMFGATSSPRGTGLPGRHRHGKLILVPAVFLALLGASQPALAGGAAELAEIKKLDRLEAERAKYEKFKALPRPDPQELRKHCEKNQDMCNFREDLGQELKAVDANQIWVIAYAGNPGAQNETLTLGSSKGTENGTETSVTDGHSVGVESILKKLNLDFSVNFDHSETITQTRSKVNSSMREQTFSYAGGCWILVKANAPSKITVTGHYEPTDKYVEPPGHEQGVKGVNWDKRFIQEVKISYDVPVIDELAPLDPEYRSIDPAERADMGAAKKKWAADPLTAFNSYASSNDKCKAPIGQPSDELAKPTASGSEKGGSPAAEPTKPVSAGSEAVANSGADEEADSGSDEEADSSFDEEATASADDEADSGADEEADSSFDEEATASADDEADSSADDEDEDDSGADDDSGEE